ncbi:hypothetical protein N7532_011447 [Penicillium argentinense]|uniref:SET domain-containing protein n=1 Tax=Penicillium argentinense TaxID=1131581 RepID=A0A9W9EIK3_9EURO|nr:uncharacterized protein N7532_011447 [Penicillium argentinense]KAJ5082404.1 hypothetical protein N7532_011447 [Penicillium argentinense]
MRREYLPLQSLPAWAKLNGIVTNGVAFQNLSSSENDTDKGNAIVAIENKTSDESDSLPQVLLQIPPELVLSLETVHAQSKSDQCLREVLEAVGDFGRVCSFSSLTAFSKTVADDSQTARGAIMIFLLIQITHSSPGVKRMIGVSNAWTDYVKFFPPSFPLPTSYSGEEQQLLRGTSLAAAVEAKTSSLEREFSRLRESTENIEWCQDCWWGEGLDKLTEDDWKYVDAAYRSRMVDLPGRGHAMVPCIDMANHVSEPDVKALYEANSEHNAVLQLRWGKSLQPGDEVTISYGDEKPASEMVFSYGFLESNRAEAKQVLLDMTMPMDDPLGDVKTMFCREAPGIRLSTASDINSSSKITWESPLIWMACVNEEDGLHIRVAQTTDGAMELEAIWKGTKLESPHHLRELLVSDPSWDIFQLRAVVLLLERIETQLALLQETEDVLANLQENEAIFQALFRPDIFNLVARLRRLEAELLEKSVADLMEQKTQLMESDAVTAYLAQQSQADEVDDFS